MNAKSYRNCTLCEAMCGIVLETAGREVVSIRGDQEDPFSKGHVCPKAVALKDLHDDEDRLRTPLRREGSTFKPISWDEAFDTVARELRRVQREHGKSAVGVYQGNPTVHNYGSMMFGPLFVRALRTRSRFSATSVDQLPHMLAAHQMWGHQLLLPIPDLDRTDYLLILGANPAVSNGSLMTAPGVTDRIKAVKQRGGRVVVLDPRRSETAQLASEHCFVRPGTDALFLLSVLHVIFAEGRERLGELSPMLTGLARVRELAESYAPDRVSALVGMEAETIRKIAREFSSADRAVCYGRVGVSTQKFGGLSCWLVNVLNIVTGNLDREGGVMFTQPAVDLIRTPVSMGGEGHFAKYRSRVRGLPEFGGELPVAALAEEIDTPGKGRIRALVTSCGNPVLSTPNGARLERALGTLDFMVSVDFYLNETTRHAHVILPPSGPLEHDHYDLVFHLLQVRNTAKYSPAVFARAEEGRHDWEIFNELTWRLEERPLQRKVAKARALLLAKLGPRGLLDVLLRIGPRGDKFGLHKPGLSLKKLEAAPHGLDFGALTPCLRARLSSPDRKIELAPELFLRDIPRLEASIVELERKAGALVLIGRRQLRSNNSWMHNSERLVKGPRRCTLEMNPVDAAKLGLAPGQNAEVRSRVGKVVAPVSVTEALMEGVVSLPHGWGHSREGIKLRVAQAHAGVSINDITDELALDDLSGNASFSGLAVEVQAVLHDESRDKAQAATPGE
jgi:anaerobic selenocysteine-containing dehydrogenase